MPRPIPGVTDTPTPAPALRPGGMRIEHRIWLDAYHAAPESHAITHVHRAEYADATIASFRERFPGEG